MSIRYDVADGSVFIFQDIDQSAFALLTIEDGHFAEIVAIGDALDRREDDEHIALVCVDAGDDGVQNAADLAAVDGAKVLISIVRAS